MIRPKEGQVLVRVLPQAQSSGGIEFPVRRKSPEEVQQDNHNPRPPEPIKAQVLAIGPWKRLANGLALLPPFPAGATILMRPGSGVDLNYDVNQKWKLVKSEDILAVVEESS